MTISYKKPGRSRGRKTGGPFSRKKGYKPWITKSGKLGGPGFLERPRHEQLAILDACVPKYGYKSCLGSILVLNRSKKIKKSHGRELDLIKQKFMHKYRSKN